MTHRHFHHQNVLCDDANIYICIAIKIINTPVNRSSSLNSLWVSTVPKQEAPSQHQDRGLCHLGTVETIMVGSYLTILDQIAKFFFLLSDGPLYWFTLNTSYDHAFHLSKLLGMDDSDFKALLIAGNLARYKGGGHSSSRQMSGNHFLLGIIYSWTCHLTSVHFSLIGNGSH